MTTSPNFLQLHDVDGRAMAEEAAAGLGAPRAHVSPKFLYDPLGSRLFDAITELAEYYPTRTEASIHAAQGAAIVDAALESTGPAPVLVDLGAGNCAKAARLFGGLAPRRYVAVDISLDFLRQSLMLLQREHPGIEMTGSRSTSRPAWSSRRAWSTGLRWCSTPDRASAISRPTRPCACCARRVRWPRAAGS